MRCENREVYEKLWGEALVAFREGRPQIDDQLRDKTGDLRRGVTLVLRPSAEVQRRTRDFMDGLAAVCPGQYAYPGEDLHVTVLSIVAGSVSWRREIRQLAACRDILRNVLRRQRSFTIRFRGVTASPGCVMIQGFPASDGLTLIREEVRAAFAHAGLGEMLDRRFKVKAAHMTAMRFCNAGADWNQLATVLERHRETNFGETTVDALELIWGDWYASGQTVRVLERYSLQGKSTAIR